MKDELVVFCVYVVVVVLLLALYIWWGLTKWKGPDDGDDR